MAKVKELGSEIEGLIIKELKDVSKDVRETMARAVTSKRPELIEGKLKEFVERANKLVGISKVTLTKDLKELIKEVAKTELRPELAEKISELVSKPVKEVEHQVRAIAESLVKAEAKEGEELVEKFRRVEVSRELPPIIRPRAELRPELRQTT